MYFDEARNRLPEERFVYLADIKYVPYGEKTADQIREAIFEAFGRLFSRVRVKAAVIACNTASVVALSELRKTYDIPFVGVVPAVKPAALTSSRKRFGVLATERTVNDIYLKNLIDSFASNCDVIVVPAPELVDLVEKRYFTATDAEKTEIVTRVVKELADNEVDTVVLGCTHYLHLEREFRRVLGDTVSLVDSREGVVNQLVRVLESNSLESEKREGEHCLYLTGFPPVEPQYLMFAEKYGLRFCGFLEGR